MLLANWLAPLDAPRATAKIRTTMAQMVSLGTPAHGVAKLGRSARRLRPLPE